MAPPPTPAAGANGVLPVPAAVIQKSNTNGASRGPSNRSAAPRLKVVVRRLPPGLTQQEFEAAIGDEWKSGRGHVDWVSYKPGKISKDMAKPSRPSRVYLHLTDKAHITVLADKVRNTAFTDAKNTTKDPCLIGPPVVAFAPWNRVPAGRRRVDQRQGTIDQDPEFKDFLESLTNPVAKPMPTDVTADPASEKQEVKTTPLIEHLREKKAAKDKPQPVKVQAKGKHARVDSKDEKAAKPTETKGGRKGGKDAAAAQEKPTKTDKAAKEAAGKEAAKILNKEASTKAKGASPSSPAAENNKPAPSPAPTERKRGNASIAKQMLQRDLGAALNPGGRRSRRETAQDNSAKDANAKPTEAASPKEPPAASPAPADKTKKEAPEAPAAASAPPPTGPAALKATPAAPQTLAPKTRHAFLKHANPSQGVTEPLIEAALAVFGAIEKVEIDKRKGFAYVDFADSDGLAKAIAASPVKVAEGAVQVLERKDRSTASANMRGRGSAGGPIVPPAPGPMISRGGGGGGGGGAGPRAGPRGRGGRGAARGGLAQTAGTAVAAAASAPSPAPAAAASPAAAIPAASASPAPAAATPTPATDAP
ncbi:hypothetical protein K490DRAFT_38150 [Saccharata proteae CBS 121410]|uniref:RRM domain-containing protein n=1 Tax=Saccharata proteae CBS 121410 TaxID=1314787 RepID=A0A6A5YBK5_9PEZI|nr:hypothetical protein K490DRAFT_38150 [Saccharata proteae CBS 121410]